MLPSDEKTIEIARRTQWNLKYMDSVGPNKIYEFTQLLNSMLGIVICLREQYYYGSTIEWEHVEKLDLRVSESLKLKSPKFSNLVKQIRHAFAHSNFNLLEDQQRITGVELWNQEKDKNDRVTETWRAEFSESEIREVARLTLNYLEVYFGLEKDGKPKDPPTS